MRDREAQLDRLIKYLHPFLMRQKIDYKIYVITQVGLINFRPCTVTDYVLYAYVKWRFVVRIQFLVVGRQSYLAGIKPMKICALKRFHRHLTMITIF